MKEKKRISTFTLVIIVISTIVGVELIIILGNVFSIKNENGTLKSKIHKLTQENRQLSEKNKSLEQIIKNFQEPNLISYELPEGYRVIRQLELGFEIGLPSGWKAEILGGKEGEPVLKVLSENLSIKMEFKAESIRDYLNIENYVSKKYKYDIYVKESITSNSHKYDIYKQSGSKLYYVFIKGNNYILAVSSNSEEYLKKIIKTFKFI